MADPAAPAADPATPPAPPAAAAPPAATPTTPAPDAVVLPPAAADWRSSIKDDKLKEHAARFTTLEDVLKGNLDLRSERDRLQSTAIVKPAKLPDTATEAQKAAHAQQVSAYRKAMDVPDDPKGYEFSRPEFIPEEAFKSEGVQGLLGELAKLAHASNAPRQVVKDFWEFYGKAETLAAQQAVAADKKFAEEAEAALRKDLGSEEAYIAHKEFGRRAMIQVAKQAGVDTDDLMKIETKSGRFLMDDPRMVKIFGKLGREMREGTLGPVNTEGDRANLDGQITAIRAKVSEAQVKGDRREAQRLYEMEMDLIRKRDGNRGIVGAAGRAA